jgi:plastocyanin
MIRLVILSAFICLAACTSETPAKSYTIHIKGMKFDPAEISVNKGDTVTWINDDMVDHDITDETKKEWSSGVLHTGKSWSKVISANADYFCSIHVVMKGKIKVN